MTIKLVILILLLCLPFFFIFALFLPFCCHQSDASSSNIGYAVKALWTNHDPSKSSKFIQNQQAIHVSVLSLCSFSGRIISGRFLLSPAFRSCNDSWDVYANILQKDHHRTMCPSVMAHAFGFWPSQTRPSSLVNCLGFWSIIPRLCSLSLESMDVCLSGFSRVLCVHGILIIII